MGEIVLQLDEHFISDLNVSLGFAVTVVLDYVCIPFCLWLLGHYQLVSGHCW